MNQIIGEGVDFYIRRNLILARTVRNRNPCSLMMSIQQNSLNMQFGHCLRMMKRCCFSSPVISLLFSLTGIQGDISKFCTNENQKQHYPSLPTPSFRTYCSGLKHGAGSGRQTWNRVNCAVILSPFPTTHTHTIRTVVIQLGSLYTWRPKYSVKLNIFFPLQQTD